MFHFHRLMFDILSLAEYTLYKIFCDVSNMERDLPVRYVKLKECLVAHAHV